MTNVDLIQHMTDDELADILTFDLDKAYEMLKEEIDKQQSIIEQDEYVTKSYHAGVKTGLRIAYNIIRLCIMKGVSEDDGTD